jgi:multiple sugar transport system ATP-binding protein
VQAPPVTTPGELSKDSPPGATLRSFFPPEAVIRPGDAVRVAVKGERAHVFHAVTGRALWHPQDGSDGEPEEHSGDLPATDGDAAR